jgi:hypothetical protein
MAQAQQRPRREQKAAHAAGERAEQVAAGAQQVQVPQTAGAQQVNSSWGTALSCIRMCRQLRCMIGREYYYRASARLCGRLNCAAVLGVC